ncbi:MAG: aminopeptidase P family N-terminal domain-containing protein, partial [Shewanella sp.]
MSQLIATRLEAIRGEMASAKLDAFIIPRADEYLGEYVPKHNERLLWATGFTGSAGMAIVLTHSAAIFTDGRYTVQVRQQVDAELFCYESLTDTPQIEWLCEALPQGARVGFDPKLHTLAWYESAQLTLTKAQIELVALPHNPIDKHWHDRPAPVNAPITLFSNDSAGKTSQQKRQEIGQLIKKAGADVALIAALDSCCWLLNIRGNDVPRLPVVLGSALLYANGEMTFYTDLAKVPAGIAAHVGEGVSFNTEAALADTLASLKGVKLLADPHSANAWAQTLARGAGASLIAGIDPVALPKAQKNAAELAGMRAC